MGYNATVVILTDTMHEIEKDPEFGKKLVQAIRYRGMRRKTEGFDPNDHHVHGAEVICVEHADYQSVIAVGGNTGRYIGNGGGWAATDDEIIRNLERDRRNSNRQKKAASK